MARTIALSEDVYRKLEHLKELLGMGYNDLIDMLIETYWRYRIEEMERLCNKLRIGDGEVEEVIKVTRELRRRKWW